MITVNKAYEFKEATVFLEISNGLMTEEEAFKYCEYYLCENLLKLYLLRVYDKSETYDDIGLIHYEIEELYCEDRKQKSAQWKVYVKLEFIAYLDCSSNTYLDRASFVRNYNNGDDNE